MPEHWNRVSKWFSLWQKSPSSPNPSRKPKALFEQNTFPRIIEYPKMVPTKVIPPMSSSMSMNMIFKNIIILYSKRDFKNDSWYRNRNNFVAVKPSFSVENTKRRQVHHLKWSVLCEMCGKLPDILLQIRWTKFRILFAACHTAQSILQEYGRWTVLCRCEILMQITKENQNNSKNWNCNYIEKVAKVLEILKNIHILKFTDWSFRGEYSIKLFICDTFRRLHRKWSL